MCFVQSGWKVDKCLLNMLGNLVLPCACQWDEYEEVHFMHHGTPPHFSAFLFVRRGLTIFFVMWASREHNNLRELSNGGSIFEKVLEFSSLSCSRVWAKFWGLHLNLCKMVMWEL